ncbi:MAG: hypothetical protein RRY79_01080 [Clostridia bacterium]
MKPKVIEISSVPCGGKTTLMDALHKKYPRSAILCFDDYKFIGVPDNFRYIPVLDCRNWDMAPLINDICYLLDNNRAKFDFIFFDYPLAPLNMQIKPFVDYNVFIDVPLDIALVRRINKECEKTEVLNIIDFRDSFLKFKRDEYINLTDEKRASANLVIDGRIPVNQLVNTVLTEMDRFFKA